jgi:hypothetical protein
MLKNLVDKLLSLFKKPEAELEITFKLEETKPWPFPVEKPKRKPQVKKATTRATKKPAVVAKTATKKTTKKKVK